MLIASSTSRKTAKQGLEIRPNGGVGVCFDVDVKLFFFFNLKIPRYEMKLPTHCSSSSHFEALIALIAIEMHNVLTKQTNAHGEVT